jgi:hypothetical protein
LTFSGLLVEGEGEGEGAGTELSRTLHLDPAVAEGVLHVSAMAASCDDDPRNRLPLVLAGMDDQAL